MRFDAGNDHAYTDSQDDSGKKLSRRVFSLKRAQAMSRILPVIEYPKRRLRNHWGVLLLEGRRGSEHYTVVLTWRNTAKLYEFHSAHFKPVSEVMWLQQINEPRKDDGPL